MTLIQQCLDPKYCSPTSKHHRRIPDRRFVAAVHLVLRRSHLSFHRFRYFISVFFLLFGPLGPSDAKSNFDGKCQLLQRRI